MAGKKAYFDPIDLKVNFPELEKTMLLKWQNERTIEKYLNKNKNSKKFFSFLDGPITANNPMGVHHAWGRTYKDVFQKYKNLKGFKQRFQNGFDCQGLWVEVEVEKELGLKNKKDIENLVPGDKYKSIEKFVELCKKRVYKYAGVQTEQSQRLGYFMDWDHSYYTLSDENNYMIWHFIKKCHEYGWLYKGNESVPWCPRCQTAISQHEILTEDYKEVTHDSVILKFPLIDCENEYLLVWTTTPWTIPANITVAVDSKLDYVQVDSEGSSYWLAEETLSRIFKDGVPRIKKRAKGSELVGIGYYGAFDQLPEVAKVAKDNPESFHKVVATDDRIMPITTDEGTGLVHTAVSAGTEDYKLGQKLGLPMIPVISDNADYLTGLGFLSGKNAKNDPWIILGYLKDELKSHGKWVFKIFKYKHRYPACWRCKEELVWKVTDEWYIAMDKGTPSLRDRMKEVTSKINWLPSFGLKRELDWLDNMSDWLISKKNRYWGLALPIWECLGCGNFEVIGSFDELKKKTIEGFSYFEGKSPHKPQIDKLKIKCSKCGRLMDRIEAVGNPWLDAGIVSFSTISNTNGGRPLYLTDRKEWEKWFPADFITESFPGQFKNWFYSLIAMSSVLENTNPFKTVLGFATLLAEDGRPMHKSWGNMIEFNQGAENIGVDVMRWMYMRQNPSENLIFGFKIADEVRRLFHFKILNIANFFISYANANNWRPGKKTKDVKINILDLWLKIKLDQMIENVEAAMEKYDCYSACIQIEMFLNDFSNWYIRLSRDRAAVENDDPDDKDGFFSTCYFTLLNFLKVLSIYLPYLSDWLYVNLTKEESVHLTDWPKAGKVSFKQNKILDKMKLIMDITEKSHSERKKFNIATRQPLSKLTVKTPAGEIENDYIKLLKKEINVKQVEWIKGNSLSVKLDRKITPELENEAKVRDLIRKIQNMRKEKGIDINTKITIVNPWIPDDQELLQLILKRTLSNNIIIGRELEIK